MATRLSAALGALLLLSLASPAGSTVIFSDGFDTEGLPGQSSLNHAAFANWTVSGGTVDLIFHGDFAPAPGEIDCGGGKCVDLDGGTSDAGVMTSISILLNPGDYELSFDLAGVASSFGQAAASVLNTVDYAVTNTTLAGQTTRSQGDPFSTVAGQFSLLAPTSVEIVIANQGGDNFGAMLDNVSLELVPEPHTALLVATGLLGLGATRRRR